MIMDHLSINTMSIISSFLDLSSLYSFLRTHKRFFKYWSEDALWHSILSRETPSVLNSTSDKRFSMDFCDEYRKYLWTTVETASKRALTRTVIENYHRGDAVSLQGIAQSSQEQQHSISNTVSSAERLFWCSARSFDTSSDEFLRYSLESLSFVYCIGVKLYQRSSADGESQQLFAPLRYRLKIGMKRDEWVYVSEPIAANRCNSMQFLIVLPRLVAGRYVQIDLIGKTSAHRSLQAYFVAVEKVVCIGLPASIRGDTVTVNVAAIDREICMDNYEVWMYKLACNLCIVHSKALAAFQRLGKARDYFETVQRIRGQTLTKSECWFVTRFYSELKGVFSAPLHCELSSLELGEALFARGDTYKAYKVFTAGKLVRGMMKCLLAMKDYKGCVAVMGNARYYDRPDGDGVMEIAKELGGDIAEEMQEFLLCERK